MARTEQAEAKVTVNGAQAGKELESLKNKAARLKAELIELNKANDKAGYAKVSKELRETTKQVHQYELALKDINSLMKRLSGASIKELEQAQRKLNAEIKSSKRETDEERKALELKQRQLRAINEELLKSKANMSAVKTEGKNWFGSMADGFNKYFGLITSIVAAIAGIQFTFRKAVNEFNEFQQKVAGLSALTGLKGTELDFFKQAAKDLSSTITPEGIKITKSANDIVEAFAKVGSARAELLNDKDALVSVTREALILSEAGQIDLDTAIKTVTTTLNTFNLQGKDAADVVNTIAAGSLAGSAEIGYLGDAFNNSASGMMAAKLQIQEGVAGLETLAKHGFPDALKAGSNFNSFLITLEAQGNKNFRPSVVGMSQALENMAPLLQDASAMAKMFGKDNFDVASALIANRQEFQAYIKAVTNTNSAVEQAITNTNTESAALAQATNQIQLKAIALGESLSPIMTTVTIGYGKMVGALKDLVEWSKRNSDTIYLVVKAITVAITGLVAYTTAKKLATLWSKNFAQATLLEVVAEKASAVQMGVSRSATLLLSGAKSLLTLNLTKATQAFRLFAASMNATPIGLLFTAVSTAATAYYMFSKNTSQQATELTSLQQIHKKYADQLGDELAKSALLFEKAKGEKFTKSERLQAIKDINAEYGTYLPNLLTEESTLNDIAAAQTLVNKKLIENIALKTRDEEISDRVSTAVKDEKTQIEDLATVSGFSVSKIRQMIDARVDLQKTIAKPIAGGKGDIFFNPDAADVGTQVDESVSKSIDDIAAARIALEEEVGKIINAYTSIVDPELPENTKGGGLVDGEALKKALDQIKDFTKKVTDTQDRMYRDSLNIRARAIAEVQAKYKDDLALAAKNRVGNNDLAKEWNAIYLALERNQKEEIDKINRDHEKKLRDSFIAAKRDLGIDRDAAFALELTDLKDKLAAEEISTDAYYIRLQILQKKYFDEALKIEEDARRKKAEMLDKYGPEKTLDQQQANEFLVLEQDIMSNPAVFTQELIEQARLKITEKYAKLRAKVEADTQQAISDKMRAGIMVAQEITSGLSSFIQTEKENELAAAGDNEEKKKAIRKRYATAELNIMIAQTLANMAMGIADIWSKWAEFPVVAAALSGLLVANAGAQIGAAEGEANRIQGFARGYYNVRDHNGTGYRAKMGGEPATQTVGVPTVFMAGEKKPEMIIDGDTMANIRMNEPGLIDAIMRHRIKGFADGHYPNQGTGTAAQQPVVYTDPVLVALMERLLVELEKGFKGKVYYKDWEELDDKVKDSEKTFGL